MFATKFLDPTNDVAFKKIFGVEKNKAILIDFLNDVLHRDGKNLIEDVKLLKNHLMPEISVYKSSIIDVLCTDQNGVRYVVEMQVARNGGFEKRAQYYAAKVYIDQIDKGGEYSNLKEVIFLAITEYVMFPDKPDYLSEHVTLDKKTGEHDLKDFSYTFIELPKFTKELSELETGIERWCYFFKHASIPEDVNKMLEHTKDLVIENAYHALEAHNWTKNELMYYNEIAKKKMDIAARESYVKNEARAEARAEALAEGKAEGRAEGKAEGIEEGARLARIEMAKTLLKFGFDNQQILNMTGLSKEELASLQQD